MKKLGKKIFPTNHTGNDFECFGPAAEKDGEFDNVMLCDMGCFKQDGQDTNKFYHGAVVQSTVNQNWYCYFEWGRVGSTKDFQFYECSSKDEAVTVFKKQLHSKNDKRGEWYTHPVLGKTLRAKKNKDCYLVRPQHVRSTGLPSSQNISTIKVTTNVISQKFDEESDKLLRDISLGTINYAKSSMATGSIPTLDAINQARLICGHAAGLPDNDPELKELTRELYSRIPKVKPRGQDIILSKNIIKSWMDDLDAFEDAVKNDSVSISSRQYPFDISHIKTSDKLYATLENYIQSATANKHSHIPSKMKIKNIWKIERDSNFNDYQNEIKSEVTNLDYKPFFVLKNYERFHVDKTESKLHQETNTHLLFHGTRSVNVGGILESGLRMPSALKGVSINGANYGSGIYIADDWKKSAGYCSLRNSYWAGGSGGVSNRSAFMFLCDTILGNPYRVRQTQAFSKPPSGHHSVFAEGGFGYIANNEFIVYKTEQHLLRFLVEFDT